eukprot:gene31443-38008_t
MSKQRKGEEKKSVEEEFDLDDAKANGGKKASNKSGLNYTAVGILLLFVLPMIFAGVIQVMDFMYPQAAQQRRIRERLVRCFEAVQPAKLNEVDYLLKKYEGKEHVMFTKLKNKYPKHPECGF